MPSWASVFVIRAPVAFNPGGAKMTTYFIIFGAAVGKDGKPSRTLETRVDNALVLARGMPDSIFLATGGVGRHGLAEAPMRDRLIAGGVDPSAILVEDQATDTLESVIYCDRILRRRGDVAWVVPCTSGYHIPRCALLLRIVGYRVRRFPVPSDRRFLSPRRWAFYVAKEMLALPYDAALLVARRAVDTLRGR